MPLNKETKPNLSNNNKKKDQTQFICFGIYQCADSLFETLIYLCFDLHLAATFQAFNSNWQLFLVFLYLAQLQSM